MRSRIGQGSEAIKNRQPETHKQFFRLPQMERRRLVAQSPIQ
ncbi:hypothetical protein [Kingella sp. (in: b-proteobacteria)]|nr:hypothetical protein [Kingella sp. (in: b-proteobacteria)]MDO4658495.1 hypothetical protein [Kingella sp. (in: b-proteobacteria)]